MANTSTTTPKKTTPKKEVVKPQVENSANEKDAEIESLKAMVLQMQQMLLNQQPQAQNQNPENSMYKYIKVINLFDGILNLKTSSIPGNSNIFTFEGFGAEKSIMYNDLRQIINANETFANEGYFYIADESVIQEVGLKEKYEKILTKEKIEKFIENDKSNVIDIFSSIPKGQQSAVVDYLVGKMAKGTEFDLNKIQAISNIYGKDLVEASKDLKHALSYKGK